jgi:hypothetical protein
MLNEPVLSKVEGVKHPALSKRDSSAEFTLERSEGPQTCPRAKRRNDTHHLTCDGPLPLKTTGACHTNGRPRNGAKSLVN